MFEQIKLPIDILSFICDKVVDFFSDYLNNRISEHSDSNKDEIRSEFECYAKDNLNEIKNSIEDININLTFVLHQQMRLFEAVQNSMEADAKLNFSGATINQSLVIININGDNRNANLLSRDEIRELVAKVANAMYCPSSPSVVNIQNDSPPKESHLMTKLLAEREEKLKKYGLNDD